MGLRNWFKKDEIRDFRSLIDSNREFTGKVVESVNFLERRIDSLQLEYKNLCEMIQDIRKIEEDKSNQVLPIGKNKQIIKDDGKLSKISDVIIDIMKTSTKSLHINEIYDKLKDYDLKYQNYNYASFKSMVYYLVKTKKIIYGKEKGCFRINTKSE